VYGIGCILYEILMGDPPFYNDNIHKLYESIKVGNYRLKDTLSEDAKSILKGLLDKDTQNRLTIKDLRKHNFFKYIDWNAIYRMDFAGLVMVEKYDSDE
jgi:serum/glucocorticoid-regulated kinase 2